MKEKNIFERNAKKSITLIVLFILLLIDVTAANIYEYVSGHAFSEAKMKGQKPFFHTTRSDIYHHDLKKSIYNEHAKWGDRQYMVATDSLGFKVGKPHDTPMVSSKPRVMFIGDSFTEGIGIRYEDTFVGRIAARLSEENIEVVNAGVASYSPIIYYRKVKYLLDSGFKFDKLYVFIDISDIANEALDYKMSSNNTVERKDDKKKAWGIRAWKKIEKNSIIVPLCSQLIDRYKQKKKPSDKMKGVVTNFYRSMWTIDEKAFQEYGEDGLKKAAYYMDQLYQLLKANNIPLTIAVYPWPGQIINNDLNSIQVTYWKAWAGKKDIGFVNFFPLFIRQDCDLQCQNSTINKLFIKGDVHWNEKGHQLIADRFLSVLSDPSSNVGDKENGHLRLVAPLFDMAKP